MPSKMSVNCFSCDSRHEDMELREIRGQQQGYFTHQFICPNTGDAVPVAVGSYKNKDFVISNDVATALALTQDQGGYMVAVWTAEKKTDGQTEVLLRCMTENFDAIHYDACVETLRNDISKRVGPPDDPPMKPASVPEQDEPFARLFGSVREK